MADMIKKMMVRQGYVPETCTLDGNIIWRLINKSEHPCSGCNEDRNKCHGRPADKDYMAKHGVHNG